MRKFGPFDTSVFYEVENRRLQRAFNPATGFVRTGQGAVTAGTGAELVIAAYPDGALIDGMYVENPASETVTLTTNTASTNPRIDRLVLRLDMGAKTIAPFQIVGTPAASPSAPTLTSTATVVDMPLCQYRFPGSASAQNPGSIVDERRLTPRTTGDIAPFTLNANGDVVIPHGLGTTPDTFSLDLIGTGGAAQYGKPYQYQAADATNLYVRVSDTRDGTPMASFSVTIAWSATVL